MTHPRPALDALLNTLSNDFADRLRARLRNEPDMPEAERQKIHSVIQRLELSGVDITVPEEPTAIEMKAVARACFPTRPRDPSSEPR